MQVIPSDMSADTGTAGGMFMKPDMFQSSEVSLVDSDVDKMLILNIDRRTSINKDGAAFGNHMTLLITPQQRIRKLKLSFFSLTLTFHSRFTPTLSTTTCNMPGSSSQSLPRGKPSHASNARKESTLWRAKLDRALDSGRFHEEFNHLVTGIVRSTISLSF